MIKYHFYCGITTENNWSIQINSPIECKILSETAIWRYQAGNWNFGSKIQEVEARNIDVEIIFPKRIVEAIWIDEAIEYVLKGKNITIKMAQG